MNIEAGNNLHNEQRGTGLQLIELRIEASENRWERDRDKKIHGIKIKSFDGLLDSRSNYETMINNLESDDFDKFVKGDKIERLMTDMRAEGMQEYGINSLKRRYIAKFKDILKFINAEIERKEPTMEPLELSQNQDQDQDQAQEQDKPSFSDLNDIKLEMEKTSDRENGDNIPEEIDEEAESEKTGAQAENLDKKEIAEAQKKLEEKIAKLTITWDKTAISSIEVLSGKDEKYLITYIEGLKKKIEVYRGQLEGAEPREDQKNKKTGKWKYPVRRDAKDLFAELKIYNTGRAAQAKNDFLRSKERVLEEAQRLLDDINSGKNTKETDIEKEPEIEGESDDDIEMTKEEKLKERTEVLWKELENLWEGLEVSLEEKMKLEEEFKKLDQKKILLGQEDSEYLAEGNKILQEEIERLLKMKEALEGNKELVTVGGENGTATIEEKKEIKQEVLDRFADELNINKEDLEAIDGFGDLSTGQQMLACENLHQLILSRVEEEGEIKQQKAYEEANWMGKRRKGMSKKLQIAKHEKESAKEFREGGIALHKDSLEKLINGMHEDGPQVEYIDGEIKILFSRELGIQDIDANVEALMADFDNVAQDFSKISDEYRYDTATKKQRQQYRDQKNLYEEARGKLLKQCEEEYNSKEAIIKMVGVDMRVHMNQFLNHHPEAVEELGKIADKGVVARSVAKFLSAKVAYSGMGFMGRSMATATLGLATAPVTAAILGTGFALRRSSRELKRMDKLGRKGDTNKGSESKDYADASYYNDSIGSLLENIGEQREIDDIKMEMLRSLRWHTEEANKKMQDGTINYGEYTKTLKIGDKVIARDLAGDNGEDWTIISIKNDLAIIQKTNSDGSVGEKIEDVPIANLKEKNAANDENKLFRIDNQYKLMKNISEATMILGYYDLFDGNKSSENSVSGEDKAEHASAKGDNAQILLRGSKLDASDSKNEYGVNAEKYYDKVFEAYKKDRAEIDKYLIRQSREGGDARLLYQTKETVKGAIMAGTFASLGLAARELVVDPFLERNPETAQKIGEYLSETKEKILGDWRGWLNTEKLLALAQNTKEHASEGAKNLVDKFLGPHAADDILKGYALKSEFDSSPEALEEAPSTSEDDPNDVLKPLAEAMNRNLSTPPDDLKNVPSATNVMNQKIKVGGDGVPVVDVPNDKIEDGNINLADIPEQESAPSQEVSEEQNQESAPSQEVPGEQNQESTPSQEVSEEQNQESVPSQGISDEQFQLATIQSEAGRNSIEGVFIEQLMDDPESFGGGEFDDETAKRKWAGEMAHRIAEKTGYVKNTVESAGYGEENTMREVRVKMGNHNYSYVLQEIDGKFGVGEYVDGELREFNPEGTNFEDQKIDINEEIYNSKIVNAQGEKVVANKISDSEKIHQTSTENNVDREVERETALGTLRVVLDSYKRDFGIGDSELKQIGILDYSDGFTDYESQKVQYLRMHHAEMEKSIEIVNMAEALKTDFDWVGDYYYQLNNLADEVNKQEGLVRQEGLIDVLKDKKHRLGFSKIFNLNIPEGKMEIENGLSRIKDVRPGLDIVVHIEGGVVKFGIDGPAGENWGAGGRSLFFKPDAKLTSKNIEEALLEIENMSASYKK